MVCVRLSLARKWLALYLPQQPSPIKMATSLHRHQPAPKPTLPLSHEGDAFWEVFEFNIQLLLKCGERGLPDW